MILLYKGNSPTSKAIKWFTRGRYSHAAWMRPDRRVYEAWHKSTDGSWWTRFRGETRLSTGPGELHTPGTEIDVYELTLVPAFVRQAIEDWLHARLGLPYDWHGVVDFVFRRPESVADRKRFFCSEYIFGACLANGVSLLERVDPYVVDPTLLSYSPRLVCVETLVVCDDHSVKPKDSPTE